MADVGPEAFRGLEAEHSSQAPLVNHGLFHRQHPRQAEGGFEDVAERGGAAAQHLAAHPVGGCPNHVVV